MRREVQLEHRPSHAAQDRTTDGRNEIRPREEAEDLLRLMGRSGWISLEDSVAQDVKELRVLTCPSAQTIVYVFSTSRPHVGSA